MKSALHSPLADDWIRGAPRLIAATLVAAAGSAVTDRRYNWDADQRMISVDSGSTASYVYNALGERVEKHAGTSYTEFIFNPQQIQADASDRSTSCCAWEYLFFGARRFGKYASNETYFSHADKIHTMGTVTDYTGAVVQDAIYHPWGQEWAMAGTIDGRALRHQCNLARFCATAGQSTRKPGQHTPCRFDCLKKWAPPASSDARSLNPPPQKSKRGVGRLR